MNFKQTFRRDFKADSIRMWKRKSFRRRKNQPERFRKCKEPNEISTQRIRAENSIF